MIIQDTALGLHNAAGGGAMVSPEWRLSILWRVYSLCGCRKLLLSCGWVSRAPQHHRGSSIESDTGSFCFSLLPRWKRTTSSPTAWFPGCSTLGSPPFSLLPHKSCVSAVNRLSLSKAFCADQVF